MIYRFLLWLVVAGWIWPMAAIAESGPVEVQKSMEKAIRQSAEAQHEADQWALDRESLMADIRDLKMRQAWLTYQEEKYQTYVQKQASAIQDLKEKIREAEVIRFQLEPFLDDVLERLQTFVASDLPFLPEERQNRIQFLKDSLEDYHLSLSEKLRRVLEALQVEAEYGRTVEAREVTLTIDGRATRVMLLRLGRLGLYYHSLDDTMAGRWNRGSGAWEPLPASLARPLRYAREMAERKRAVELLNLPLEAVQP